MYSDFHKIFYLRHEGISYWAALSWSEPDHMEWTKKYDKDDKWYYNVSVDDIPKQVQTEYLLWLMQVDKH